MALNENSKKKKGTYPSPATEWNEMFKFIRARLLAPFKQPAYVFFFLVSMVIGATGIWVAMAEAWLLAGAMTPVGSIWDDASVFNSMLTFFAALGSLSCIQVIVIEDKQKSLRALLSLLLILFIGLAILAALVQHSEWSGYPIVFGGTGLAIIAWWFANSDDSKYTQGNVTDALGGPTEAQPAGDTGGFSV